MGFAGFDTEKIGTLAGGLEKASQGAGPLHRQVAMVLTRANGLLNGSKPVTTSALLQPLVGDLMGGLFFGGYRCMPGTLTGELDDTQASMKRRCAQLGGVQKLVDDGYDVDPSLYFDDEKPPDQKKINTALTDLAELNGKNAGDTDGRSDLERIKGDLDGLTPTELDAFLDKVPAGDLAHFNDVATHTGNSGIWPFQHSNGLPSGEYRDFTSSLLKKAGPTHWPKIEAAFPVQPGFDTTDAWLEGQNSQQEQGVHGMHYGTPQDPLFKTPGTVDASGAHQGQIGDCWYMASLEATAQADPKFIAEGVKQNPNGTVNVRIWDKDGKLHWVTVTPDIPMDSDNNPVSAYGADESWPAYYEKAFALMYAGDTGGAPDDHQGDPLYDRAEQGDYGATEWDFTDKAPPYVTGSKSKSIGGGFDGVKKAYQSHHPVIVATPSEDELKKKNLDPSWDGNYVTRHVYYVKGFDAQGNMLLGNPWGPGNDVTVTPEQYKEYFETPQQLQVGK
ncbi:C2 family cysteine protease [Streptomyces sp. NBC_00669]|uniref:C2 family cysteine protease n=1 Tax=Streptomyces sp. NBC_00669 TaxID=2976011 RepID=UPI002E37C5DE|nr:C2 family cysteine protease [Streptomyces sp. NBC_00669]